MKRWRNFAGSALAFFGMSLLLYVYGGDFRSVEFTNPELLPGLTGSVAVYVAVILIGAFGWKLVLTALGATPQPWVAERQLLISQIGKYVPGNIAQYLGRAAMAIEAGVPAKTVGIALVIETAALLLGAVLAVGIALAGAPDSVEILLRQIPVDSKRTWLQLASAAFLLLLLGFAWIASKRLGNLPKLRIGRILVVILIDTIALLLLGVSLHLIVTSLSQTPAPLLLSVAVFAAAWIAGLATPGAPGGLGIRETVITLGLAPLLGGPTALSVALLHRGASVLGDAIAFGLGLLLPRKRFNCPS